MPGNDAEFLKRLLAAFKLEGEEHVTAIGSGLVELENTSTDSRQMEIVEVIFREAHSLKGAARAVNLGRLEGICQSMETIFAGIKARTTTLSPQLFDRLHTMVAAIEAELAIANEPRPAAKPEPRPLVVGPPPESAPKPPLPSPPPEERPGLPDTVRVATSKLDALLRQAEELISSKAVTAHRVFELRGVDGELAQWKKEWKKVRSGILPPGTSGGRNGGGAEPSSEELTVDRATVLAFLDRNEQVLHSVGTQVAALGAALDNDRRTLDRRVGDLLEDIKRVSMLPFATLLTGFPKLARDLCRDSGKDAALVIKGGEIEASRRILDEIKDPLLHLIRNCIDHGIESIADRERSRKPRRATITITITPKSGDKVELAIADDGAGIDTGKLIAAAIKQGLISRDEAQTLDERRALLLIFQSGLSTSAMVTTVSGRGLGLAIVREKVEGLGGSVAVETQPGLGTTFRLTLPLTLATFRGVLVRAGHELFVIPTMHVQRALRVDQDAVKSVENRAAIEFNGRAVSLVWLADALGMPGSSPTREPGRKWPGVLLEWAGEEIVFLVDEVLRDQEVLVKGLGKQLRRVRNISGAAVLESGEIAPVLSVADLMRSAAATSPAASSAEPEAEKKSILVAEDSITARTLIRGILESAGYAVTTAVNGAEAFSILENGGFDLVVSDVEMPRMTGFDLTARIRANRRFTDLPVVLVTGLDSRQDRERGAEVGANAYIVKSSFDQSNLLEVVQRLI